MQTSLDDHSKLTLEQHLCAQKELKFVLVPWVEKYQSETVDEVAHRSEVGMKLRKGFEGADLPNPLFYGPPERTSLDDHSKLTLEQHLCAQKELKFVLVPWVEKYQSETVDEVAHRSEVGMKLRKGFEGADLPNPLFYGPPERPERVFQLNASDERGIDVISQKVRTFAHLTVAVRSDGSSGAGSIPPYKLIVPNVPDSMTTPAQVAFRRTVQTEIRTTRLCSTCNYVMRIIDPITSRCAKFLFHPLNSGVAQGRLRHIRDAEGLSVPDEVLDNVLQLSHGDPRQGITMLQSVCQLWISSLQVNGARVSEEQLDDVAAAIPTGMLTGLVEAAQSGRFDDLKAQSKAIFLEGHLAHRAIY
ncbi:Replication factor C small subunit [Paragonimus kellicotti]|nr:Replication factor C small subunit [Paragonimus kellicotti]